MDQYPDKNNIELKMLCVVGTEETSVHINRDQPFQSSGIQSRLKWQENSNAVRKKHSICTGSQGLMVKRVRLLLKWKWEAQGKKRDARPSRAQGGKKKKKSAKIALFFLYGFLDAEKHGGEPLVQPWNGIVLLHLTNQKEILPKTNQHKTTTAATTVKTRICLLD